VRSDTNVDAGPVHRNWMR